MIISAIQLADEYAKANATGDAGFEAGLEQGFLAGWAARGQADFEAIVRFRGSNDREQMMIADCILDLNVENNVSR